MISLEQIRLLESKVARAVELIRVLKEENATLRRGLESAQRRMKELETLVDGFKADQKEIESAILRALGSLDELEESLSASKAADGTAHRAGNGTAPRAGESAAPRAGNGTARREPSRKQGETPGADRDGDPASPRREARPAGAAPVDARATKDELDIF